MLLKEGITHVINLIAHKKVEEAFVLGRTPIHNASGIGQPNNMSPFSKLGSGPSSFKHHLVIEQMSNIDGGTDSHSMSGYTSNNGSRSNYGDNQRSNSQ